MNLFRKKPIQIPEPVRVQVQHVNSVDMRLEQWRKQETLVAESMRLASNQTYKIQLQVLQNEHPCHLIFSAVGVSPNDRIAHQAKCEGYELALNNLAAMSKPFKTKTDLVATFEPPETKKPK